MLKPTIVYRYDGSFEGFLCCVFDSFYRRETPVDILPEDLPQGTLYPERWIETDREHARRVYASFTKKISPSAAAFITQAFLSCQPEKERLLLRFIRMGYRYRSAVLNCLADDTVNALTKAVKFLNNEAHLFKEFLRFSEQNGTLAAIIEPKNQVLPLLAEHFCSRYPEERFLIYDSAHHEALVYKPYEPVIVPLEDFSLPRPEEQEARYRVLWKRFYDSVAVEGRYNPKCRMGHMPKRYWKNMAEFQPDASFECPSPAFQQAIARQNTTSK